MRWTAVALALVAAACGGRSRTDHAPPTAASAGSGGTSAGGSGSGGDGTGASGVVPYEPDPVAPGDSAECQSYKSEPNLYAACSALGYCKADLESFLEALTFDDGLKYYFARVGCGVTELVEDGELGGGALDFGSDGALIGYQSYSDASYGPCSDFQYARGQHLGDCAGARECTIASDAFETGEVCRCACPEPPPSDGVASVDLECVDRPSRGWTCGETLDRWGELGEYTGLNGNVRTACGATVVQIVEDEGVLDCVYDSSEALVGLKYESASGSGCEGVRAWQGGVAYSTCAAEKTCSFGLNVPDSAPPLCGKYPYQ